MSFSYHLTDLVLTIRDVSGILTVRAGLSERLLALLMKWRDADDDLLSLESTQPSLCIEAAKVWSIRHNSRCMALVSVLPWYIVSCILFDACSGMPLVAAAPSWLPWRRVGVGLGLCAVQQLGNLFSISIFRSEYMSGLKEKCVMLPAVYVCMLAKRDGILSQPASPAYHTGLAW